MGACFYWVWTNEALCKASAETSKQGLKKESSIWLINYGFTGKAVQLAPSDIEVTYKPGDEG